MSAIDVGMNVGAVLAGVRELVAIVPVDGFVGERGVIPWSTDVSMSSNPRRADGSRRASMPSATRDAS